jgi:methionine-rich copper-binding protein CopC
MMKRLISLAIAFGVALAGAPSANAHASVTGSNPKPGAVLKTMPKVVWVEFDGNIITLGKYSINSISIKGPKKEYAIGKPLIGGARLSTETKGGSDRGSYILTYRVVSEDGHPISGSFKFKIN